jgi:hypothetical protein
MIQEIPEPPELDIGFDQLAFIVVKAREFDAKEGDSDPDSGSDPIDDGGIDILADGPDDPTEEELRGAISDLNDDEKVELLAIIWIGRGDFGPEQWDEAQAEARSRPLARAATYCLSLPLLSDYIETGLDALGVDISEFEDSHL